MIPAAPGGPPGGAFPARLAPTAAPADLCGLPSRPQDARESASELQPRLRVTLGHERVFGPGKAELLRLIGETGSIRSAAARIGMSYNRAWGLVRDANRHFRKPLVLATRGGGTGGGARLTAAGREALSRYLKMDAACRKAAQADWRALRRLLR